ncbi:MAG: PAS domain S-box protein, partial [Desulfomonile tiedjei]|nr:PAS domain S-box protein [Desulfomonile tiedjei]
IQKGPKILFANSLLNSLLGYAPWELEGMYHWFVYHRDYQELTRERAIARMRGEKVTSQYEVKLQRKDGDSIDGEISARGVKVKGEPGVLVWVRDISKRKRSEEAQRRLATAVEQAAEAIVITDTGGSIQYVNPAFERVSGYPRDEVIGQNPRVLKSGNLGETFYKNLWDTIRKGEVWTGRFINKKKDGSIYQEDSTISPVRDSHGKIVNFVAVKRDMTEHLQLSEQLLQAQKMEAVGILAGGIAHDFNNLLQVTLGYSELLLSQKEDDDPDSADLQKIFHAAKNGAELVQRLLTFSRKVEPNPVPLNLNRQVIQVEKLLRRTIPKMIAIQLDLSDELARIHADPSQVEQVLMNLAVNARDAMPDGGKLTVRTRTVALDGEWCKTHVGSKPGEYVLLTVSDTGLGMDKATVDHIFEPFYTTKELGRGTGLGLAMVYGIVKQHNGHITCESEVGSGTSFNVYFPAIEAREEPRMEDSGIMPAFGMETLLLVDDEEFIRELGRRILSKAGYTVLTATNGREALDLFNKEGAKISLVILDLIMPEMGGKDCLKGILEVNPHVKVLMASGLSAQFSMKESFEMGASGFVGKPFRIKELLGQVRKILDET